MSTAIFEAKASGMATKNDALRDAFAVDSIECYLLKRSEYSQAFTLVETLTNGYRVKFDDNRSESGLFRHATTDIEGFSDLWAEATHIAYGAANSIEVYEMIPEEKDAIDPDASSVYYSARIRRLANERYTPTA